jgi:hypothetical protein
MILWVIEFFAMIIGHPLAMSVFKKRDVNPYFPVLFIFRE